MRFTTISALLATSISLAAAQNVGADGITTLTSTTTMEVTITQCGDDVENCPGRTTATSTEVVVTTETPVVPEPEPETTTEAYTPPPVVETPSSSPSSSPSSIYTPPASSPHYPANNSTQPGPTAPASTPVNVPTTIVTEVPGGQTSIEVVVGTTTTPVQVPSTVPTGAASSLMAQSGLVAAAVAAAAVALF